MSCDDIVPDDGVVRLFPLPNLVLFPGAVLPLHIFEPRYREMTSDALAGDRLIGMVLPRPGWEDDYAGAPALHPVACVGRIVAEQRLVDGRFNVLLRGLARVRIVEELATPKLYRAARVEVLSDVPGVAASDEALGRQRLRTQAREWFQTQSEVRDRFLELIDGDIGLGALIDLIAFALPLDAAFKQTLLQELNVFHRLDRLLRQLGSARRGFPPEFSAN